MSAARRDRYTPPGHHRDLASFRAHWLRLAPDLGVDEQVRPGGPLAQPAEAFGRRVGNRFAVQPMEGWDGAPDGTPSELTRRRWRRFGRSGAKLIWGGEAFAVQGDGKANARQLFLNDAVDVRAGMARLVLELLDGHREAGDDPADLVFGLQLTHSGRWSRPAGRPEPRVATRDRVLDARVGVDDDAAVLGDDELQEIRDRYVAAAEMARDVGFHFVDVKCCHGYLLHELLGARGRAGRYGGEDFDDRTRLFREIVECIRGACPDLGIGVRVSIGDVGPFRRGADGVGEAEPGAGDGVAFARGEVGAPDFDANESFAFLRLCREIGIDMVNLTLGSPYYCPHLQRPASYPPSDGYLPPEDPLWSVARHLRMARSCKRAVPELPVVGTGYSYLQEWLPQVAQHEVGGGHVDFVGLGRMVLSYPELPRDVLAGRPLQKKLLCRTFSDCTTAPRNGMVSGCYPLDSFYRERPEAAEVKRVKAARKGD